MPWPNSGAVAGRVDHRTGRGVDVVATVGAGAHRGEPRQLRRKDDIVDAAQLAVGLAGSVGARDVAAVAVHARAGVDHDQLARRDHALPRDRVRLRAMAPAATIAGNASPSAPRR